jgi:hypothetical protein
LRAAGEVHLEPAASSFEVPSYRRSFPMTAMTPNPDVLPTQGRKVFPESDFATEVANGETRSFYQKGKEKVLRAEENFEGYVRAHPIKTVLMATGVGLVIGALLGRRR